MTFKFTTLLQWFELGETFIRESIWMEWYCYDPTAAQSVKGFDFRQVPLLEAYMKSTENFAGMVSYQPAYEEEIPLYIIEDSEREFPGFLIIGPGQDAVNVTLYSEDGLVPHYYNLEFSIIGKVLGLNEKE
jgi:hypothetical protein